MNKSLTEQYLEKCEEIIARYEPAPLYKRLRIGLPDHIKEGGTYFWGGHSHYG